MTDDQLAELRYYAQADARRRIHEQTQCGGKVKFDNPDIARKYIAHREHRKGNAVYRCQFCKGWHLGVKKPPSARPRRDDVDERMGTLIGGGHG